MMALGVSRNKNGHSAANDFLQKIKVKSKRYDPGVDIILECHFKVQYYGKINIGTAREGEEPQWFYMFMDTGSSDMWVPGLDAYANSPEDYGASEDHRAFDPSRSLTFRGTKELFSNTYADGTDVAGSVGVDAVTIGTIKIPKVRFGTAKVIKNAHMKADGILGLGFGANSGMGGSSFIEQLFKQSNVLPQFGITFADKDSNGNNLGHLFIGGHDRSLVDGKFAIAKVIKEYFTVSAWAISIDGISVGGKKLPIAQGMRTIIDSGSSIIAMPQRLIDEILMNMPEKDRLILQSQKIFHCDDVDLHNLPDISFIISRKSFVLTPPEYMEVLYKTMEGDDRCVLSLEAHDMFAIVLGDTFMKKYYVRFDMGKKEIGFAKFKKKASENHENGRESENNVPAFTSPEDKKDPNTASGVPNKENDNDQTSGDNTHVQNNSQLPENDNNNLPTINSDIKSGEKEHSKPIGVSNPVEIPKSNNNQPEDKAPIEGEFNSETQTGDSSVDGMQDSNKPETPNNNGFQTENLPPNEKICNNNRENNPYILGSTPIEETNNDAKISEDNLNNEGKVDDVNRLGKHVEVLNNKDGGTNVFSNIEGTHDNNGKGPVLPSEVINNNKTATFHQNLI